MKTTIDKALKAKIKLEDIYGNYDGVVGFGITKSCNGDFGVKVHLTQDNLFYNIPNCVDGVFVETKIVGLVKPFKI